MKLEVDSVDHSDEVNRAFVNSAEADSDFLSFAAAAAGGARDYTLELTIAQDPATGTLWSEIFDNVGDEVPYSIAPFGNATPTPEQPHFEGNAIISEPDGALIGAESTTSTTAVATVEVSWKCTGRPVKVTA